MHTATCLSVSLLLVLLAYVAQHNAYCHLSLLLVLLAYVAQYSAYCHLSLCVSVAGVACPSISAVYTATCLSLSLLPVLLARVSQHSRYCHLCCPPPSCPVVHTYTLHIVKAHTLYRHNQLTSFTWPDQLRSLWPSLPILSITINTSVYWVAEGTLPSPSLGLLMVLSLSGTTAMKQLARAFSTICLYMP